MNLREASGPDRPTRMLALAIVALATTGCQLTVVLGNDELTLFWLIGPLLVSGGASALWAYYMRRRELDTWDLSAHPTDPGGTRVIGSLITVASTLAVAWMLANALADVEFKQKVFNVLGWTLGSGLGALFGYFGGLHLAEGSLHSDRRA